jgi:hypothetical protein
LGGSVQLGHYPPAIDQYRAVLQDDGNFVVFRNAWTSTLFVISAIDPVRNVEISKIEHNLPAAKTLHAEPAALYRQTVRNDSPILQESTISGASSVTETSGWSDSLGIKLGEKSTFTEGIPLVAEGEIEVAVEVTNTFTWNGSTAKAKTWGFSTPVSVPAMTTIVGLVSATLSTIAVPYTLTGTFVVTSGARIPGSVDGTYTGSNSNDLTVSAPASPV